MTGHRIAFAIHDARPTGGQDRYALELVNRMSERHEVTLFARTAEGLADRVRFEPISVPDRPPPLRDLAFSRRARARIRRGAWDIVHSIGGALPGAAVITTQYCHRGWLEAAQRWPSALVGRWETPYRAGVARLAARDEGAAARHPSLRALIAVSRRTAEDWRRAYGPLPAVSTVIPNGVDAGRFSPVGASRRDALRKALDLPAGGPLLLIVGALVRKGVETALAVLPRLEADVHLVALGAGPHHRIRRVARSLGVGDRIHLRPPSPTPERYFQAADVFVFPSRYEPFGMVVAEAWACGLPVVASEVTGAIEWARPDHHAVVVADPADTAGFEAGIRRVLSHPDFAASLGRNGRALVDTFHWDAVVAATEAVYDQVAGRHRPTFRDSA